MVLPFVPPADATGVAVADPARKAAEDGADREGAAVAVLALEGTVIAPAVQDQPRIRFGKGVRVHGTLSVTFARAGRQAAKLETASERRPRQGSVC